jgi:hypothetical protein
MVRKLSVISSYLDGADLQRAKAKNSHYTIATGKNDEEVLNEANIETRKNSSYSLPEWAKENWERIFRGK